MPIVISSSERAAQLRKLEQLLGTVRQQATAIANLDREYQANQYPATEIEDSLQPLLDSLDDQLTQLAILLNATSVQHQLVISIGQPASYQWALIDAADVRHVPTGFAVSGAGVIQPRPDGASPFVGLLAGDKVLISKAEDAANNLSREVAYAPQEATGVDLIVNGGFDTDTDWTKGAGWTIAAGVADTTGAISTAISLAKSAMVSAGAAWVNGVPFLVTFTVVRTSGSLAVGTNTNANFRSVDASGTYEAVVPSDGHANGLIFTGASFDGTIDNVSAVPCSWLTFTDVLGADNATDTKLVVTLEER